MRDAQPVAVHLRDYEAPVLTIRAVDLELELEPGTTTVRSRLTVERCRDGAAELQLDGQELELVSVAVDGETLSENAYRLDEESLTLFGLPDRCEVTIVNRIRPEENTALEGLYKSGTMYCTQCEAEGFRKITYYQDRPDVLATFRTSIIAGDDYPILLSNGNPVADERLDDGRRRVTWHDPFPKPSYLFALVAGDLALLEDSFRTRSGRTVELRIYSEPHNISQCAYAMGVLKRSMRWDEERFGREYDLDIFMIVAVDDFNMGAMENKGLNIFNTFCVLATPDTATDQAYQRVEGVVAHEYFHNWSGNRVTCRDWFQLSLKEGFTVFRDAEFSSDMNSRTVKRIEDVNFLRAVQFAEDAGPLAHPIRPDSYIEISNFYTPTIYEKGAEVIGMLHRLLGPEAFRAGSDLYFERHDGQAVTTEDFLAAMADASGVDLDLFERWYQQAGTPRLAVRERREGDRLTLDFEQSCPATPGQPDKLPVHMPVALGLVSEHAGPLTITADAVRSDAPLTVRGDTLLLELKETKATLTITLPEPDVAVSMLRDFSAPVRLAYPRSEETLTVLAQKDSNGFAAWDAMQTLLVSEVTRLPTTGTVSDTVCELYRTLLLDAGHALRDGSDEDRFVLAAKLSLPGESYLFEQLDDVDVDAVIGARDALRRGLALACRDELLGLYEQARPQGAYAPDATGMSRRALRNLALDLLVEAAPATLETLVSAHYRDADNLTDRRAALAAAGAAPVLGALSPALLNDFLARFRKEALVVNQWFSVQAASPLTDAAALRGLAAHGAFELTNPNKVRAVFGAFLQANLRNFHAADGSGYELIGEAVTKLNTVNPQMAAALAKPLGRWRRVAGARSARMRHVLETLAARDDLSTDVYEVVSKSLDAP